MAGDVNETRSLGADLTQAAETWSYEHSIQYTSYTAGLWPGSVRLCGHRLSGTSRLVVSIRPLGPAADCSRCVGRSRG